MRIILQKKNTYKYNAVTFLERELEGETAAFAYLFSGPVGTGKRALAEIFARALNCAGAVRPCDTCEQCRIYDAARETLFLALGSETPESISIAHVRELTAALSIKPWVKGVRTIIINHAEAIERAAASALLKILEEPPERTVFILIDHQTKQVLPTIRSRCRVVHVSPPPRAALITHLKTLGVSTANAEELYVLAGGMPETAHALAIDANRFTKERSYYSAIADAVAERNPNLLMKTYEPPERLPWHEQQAYALTWLTRYARTIEAMLVAFVGKSTLPFITRSTLTNTTKTMLGQKLAKALHAMLLIKKNVPGTLAVEHIVYDIS
jgi:DNA polymerase III delta prime subunit